MDAELAVKRKKSSDDHHVLLWQVILVLVVVCGMIVLNRVSAHDARLTIDFGDHQRAFEGEVIQNMTVLDALRASVAAGRINLTFEVAHDQTIITAFDGHSNPLGPGQISFTLNGQPINATEIHKIPVHPKDHIMVMLAGM